MTSITVTINNETGLHARPATLFVSQAAKFKSDIKIQKKDRVVSAKSIMGILSLGVVNKDEISIMAEGEDEIEAVEALRQVIERNMGE